MNVSATTIYFWQLADRVIAFLPGLGVFVLVALVITVIVSMISNYDQAYQARKGDGYKEEHNAALALYKQSHRLSKLLGCLGGLFFFLAAVIPTSNTIAMMVVIPEIAKSKVIQTDLPDLYNAAVSALKAAIAPEKK